MTASPLYFDCDTGIDDAMALAYILASPEVSLVGIGTVCGNIDTAQATRNTLDLLAFAGRGDVPVAMGAQQFLTRAYNSHVTHIHGENGIGNVALPGAAQNASNETAAEMLIRLADQHQGKLRLVTTGPLTNLAEALRLDPTLPSRIADLTIMGGAAMVPGNITVAAEANIANDPEAAALVLAADWPITLVPLDVTMNALFEERQLADFLHSSNPVVRAVGEMHHFYFDFYQRIYGRRCCALHDPLAAMVAIQGVDRQALAPVVNVVVDTSNGPGRGQTLCDLRGRFVGFPVQTGAHCRVLLKLPEDTVEKLLGRILSWQL